MNSTISAGISLSVSMLAIFPAPAKGLWYLAIAVTGWPWVFALGNVFWAISQKSKGLTKPAAGMFFLATLLYLSPYVRAAFLRGHLQSMVPPVQGNTALEKRTLRYFSDTAVPLEMDLLRPLKVQTALPLVLVVHGGSWQSGDRTELSKFNELIAQEGYVVAAPDYRLAPKNPWPAGRQDVLAAIAHLKTFSKQYGIDASRIAVLGRSAGGQMALSAAFSQNDPAVRATISLYAPLDMVWAYSKPSNPLIMNSKDVLEKYMGGTPDQKPGTYEAASPVLQVGPHTPPTLLIHGTIDPMVWPHHSRVMAAKLKGAGRPYQYVEIPWATHGAEFNPRSPAGKIILGTLRIFLKEHL